MEKEAKKEAFRKYLESSGVLDALTKVLVALYEQNDKPSSAVEFVQQKLGGPTVAEHEKLLAEISDLQSRHDELFATHQEVCREIRKLDRRLQFVRFGLSSPSFLKDLEEQTAGTRLISFEEFKHTHKHVPSNEAAEGNSS